MFRFLWLMAPLFLAGCAAAPVPDLPAADPQEVAELGATIRGLGEGVDPEEAARAASIAFSYSRQLAHEYRVTDPPVIHNAKVHLRLRERGLCYHWAEDLEARLLQENFRTLQLHRAIAPESLVRLEHSTVVISRKGESLHKGVVLDPWRMGGRLFWAAVNDDADYDWRPDAEVLAARGRAAQERRQGATTFR